ncbi:MAG: biotin/lipoyl-binding protein [Gammaproteobacteria bacterium]|nr:biotin/lipoyl-binding protein [Gammaproteobacteria bacterium]NKB63631.1 biotin/lipoyl-binding protein [Gammaproteobacteria bacterium]NKB65305.1 biotin/lipoyl-binding protein [Gammaproteobacteria bacterium]
MRVLKIVLPVAVLVAGFLSFQYLKSGKPTPEPLTLAVNVPVVQAQTVELASISPTIKLFGQVETTALSTLSAAIEADVISVKVQEGHSVKKGQLMVALDDGDTALAIQQRQAEIAEIEALIASDKVKYEYDKSALVQERELLGIGRKSVKRAKKLVSTQAGSEATLDSALQQEQQLLLAVNQRKRSIAEFTARQQQLEARRLKAKAALIRSQRDLQRTEIRAPFDGKVSQSMVSVGDRVNKGTSLFKLYDERGLEIRAQIPNQFIGLVQSDLLGKKSTRAQTLINENVVDIVPSRISAQIAKGQGGVDVFFGLPPEVETQLGRTVEITVELPALENVVPLPVDALYGSDKVYVIEENKLKSKKVSRLGKRQIGREQQLLIDGNGFAEGDQVLVSRLPQASQGLAVEIDGTTD